MTNTRGPVLSAGLVGPDIFTLQRAAWVRFDGCAGKRTLAAARIGSFRRLCWQTHPYAADTAPIPAREST